MLRFAIALLLVGACAPPPELPTHPPALPAPSVPADLEPPGGAWGPLTGDLPALSGNLKLSGELTQSALGAPPLRLTLSVTLRAEAGQLTLLSAESMPETLAKSLQDRQRAPSPARDWPLTVLELLVRPPELEAWLATPPRAGDCRLDRVVSPAIEVRTSALESGRLVTYRLNAEPTGAHRGEVAGYVHYDRRGRVTRGHVELRRWTRYDHPACRLVQSERLTLTAAAD